ncbi:hypothetical protein Plhal304r1_c055g0140361 [Plasmopara halstedii]
MTFLFTGSARTYRHLITESLWNRLCLHHLLRVNTTRIIGFCTAPRTKTHLVLCPKGNVSQAIRPPRQGPLPCDAIFSRYPI